MLTDLIMSMRNLKILLTLRIVIKYIRIKLKISGLILIILLTILLNIYLLKNALSRKSWILIKEKIILWSKARILIIIGSCLRIVLILILQFIRFLLKIIIDIHIFFFFYCFYIIYYLSSLFKHTHTQTKYLFFL